MLIPCFVYVSVVCQTAENSRKLTKNNQLLAINLSQKGEFVFFPVEKQSNRQKSKYSQTCQAEKFVFSYFLSLLKCRNQSKLAKSKSIFFLVSILSTTRNGFSLFSSCHREFVLSCFSVLSKCDFRPKTSKFTQLQSRFS